MVTAAVRYKESPLDTASWNFSAACGRLALDADLKARLAMPYRELALQLPVHMEDGTLRVFRAARILHNNARGPAAGRILISSGADADLALAHANIATWTAALHGIPFGGSSAFIDVDLASLSDSDYEQLIRCFTSRAHIALGPYQDVVIAGNERDASLILDEYSALHGPAPACVVGKPSPQGGIGTFSRIHAHAAAVVLREFAARTSRELKDLRIAIYATPETVNDYLAEFGLSGCTVVAATDGSSVAHSSDGILPLATLLSAQPSVAHNPDSVLSADCEVLVLAASECLVNTTSASRIRASILLEAAPLGVTPSADVILAQQNATVLPDLLAAAGALIATEIEWSANLERLQPRARDVDAAIEKIVPRSLNAVFDRMNREHSSLRAAAHCIAVERVARTQHLRTK